MFTSLFITLGWQTQTHYSPSTAHTHTHTCVWTVSGNTSKCRIPLFTSHIRLTSKRTLRFRPEFFGQTNISPSQRGDEALPQHSASRPTWHQNTCIDILQHGLRPGHWGFDLWTGCMCCQWLREFNLAVFVLDACSVTLKRLIVLLKRFSMSSFTE